MMKNVSSPRRRRIAWVQWLLRKTEKNWYLLNIARTVSVFYRRSKHLGNGIRCKDAYINIH